LLGVPDADRPRFREQLLAMQAGPTLRDPTRRSSQPSASGRPARDPLAFLTDTFTTYVEDRRRKPEQDVLTQLATATYPDGSQPAVDAVVRMAVFLFAAGQDTTTRLVAWTMRFLAEDPALQGRLRADPELIPNFIEEVLRLESPVKADFRMARRSTTVAGVEIPAGTTVMILPGAANRDPRQFERPTDLSPERSNAQTHLSFGRGIHSCPGGPLSRIEVRVSLEQLLGHLGEFRIDEKHHGPPNERRFPIEPIYILRGMEQLHITFEGNGDS
jgi:cytochrome P450